MRRRRCLCSRRVHDHDDAVCAVDWEMLLADAVVETHDRIVGRTYRAAVRTYEAQLGDETAAVRSPR